MSDDFIKSIFEYQRKTSEQLTEINNLVNDINNILKEL